MDINDINVFNRDEILSNLYAYYGQLLTKRQQKYFEDYYYNDLSLREIADNYQVSRQAILDNVQRSSRLLIKYEQKLHMMHDYQEIEQKLETLAQTVKQNRQQKALADIQQLIAELRGE